MKCVVPVSAAFLCIASPSPASAQELLDGPHWPVPGAMGELAHADMNRDGRPDILLAATQNRVGYLPSLGFGRFGPPVFVVSPGPCSAPTAADFTSDGFPDLITTMQGAVRVQPSGPGGTLGAPITTPVTGMPTQSRSVCAVDLDLDGKRDVVFDCNGGRVIYLLGDGTGAFGSQTNLSVGAGGVGRVATGHLNNDPWPDIVSATDMQAADISVFLSIGPARFAAPVHYAAGGMAPSGLDVGDFTGDGLADVAFTQVNWVLLYANTGNGTLSPLTPVGPTGPITSVQIADMDEDGLADLVHGAGEGMGRIALGTGGGTFGTGASFYLGSHGTGVLVLDVDSDGHLDVARNADGVSVVYGDGNGSVGCARDLPGFSIALDQGDLNHDWYADLIVNDGAAIRVLLQLPGGGFAPPIVHASTGIWDVAVGFIDAGPHLDVLASGTDGKAFARLGDGLGGLGPPIATQLQATSKTIAVADLDGDGFGDLVAMPEIGWPPSWVHVHLGTGTGTFGPATVIDVGSFVSDPEVADIDQDWDLDLAFATGPGSQDTLLINDGTGHFTKTLVATGANTNDLRLIDVSGDGIVDLIGAGQ